jgi:hypothetical protein
MRSKLLTVAEKFLTIGRRRHAVQLFEKSAEIEFVGKSQLRGDFLYGITGLQEQLDGFLVQAAGEVRLGTESNAASEAQVSGHLTP